MKKEIRTFALFAVLTLAATSCQKEIGVNPMAISEQTSETIDVVYSIDGEVFRITINESEWDAFVERMLALAREGYRVSFSKNGDSMVSPRKEIVTFTTTSEEEAHAWANNMANQGYEVTITYDKKTKIYTCEAVK